MTTRSVAFHLIPTPRGVWKMGSLTTEASILSTPSVFRRPFFCHPRPAPPPLLPDPAARRRRPPVFQFLAGRLPGCLHFLDDGDAVRRLPSYSNGVRRLENRQPPDRGVHFISTLSRQASIFLPASARGDADPTRHGASVVRVRRFPVFGRPSTWVFTILGCWRRGASPSILFHRRGASRK